MWGAECELPEPDKVGSALRADLWSLALTRFFSCADHLRFDFSLDVKLVIYLDTAMGYPTKVQLIERKDSEQFYINFPAPIAQAMDFAKGEVVEWTIADKKHLILSRTVVPPDPVDLKKKRVSP